jgi:hypothetical protein
VRCELVIPWFLVLLCDCGSQPRFQGAPPTAAKADTGRPPIPTVENLPGDSTYTAESPDYPRAGLLYYRNVISIAFFDTTSGTTIRRILQQYSANIIGGVAGPAVDPEYIVQIPDPGPTLQAVDAVVASIGAQPGVRRATKLYYRTPIRFKRHSGTGAGRRASRS